MSYLNPRWENVAFAAFLILPTVPYPVCAAIVEEPSVSELMALGAPTLAWDKIQKKPQLNQKLQAEEIAQHRLSLYLRWGLDESRNDNGPQRLIPLNETVNNEQEFLTTYTRKNASAYLQVLGDQIVALSAKGDARMAIVRADELEKLTALPAYVSVARGDAFMQLEQPEKAVASYEYALTHALPGEIDPIPTQEMLFYALLDCGRYEQAEKLLSDLEPNTPQWVRLSAAPGLVNPDYATVKKMRAQYTLYSGNITLGQRQIDNLVHSAPMNDDLLTTQAQAYLLRDLPTHSAQAYRIALNQTPDSLEARAGLGEASLARRDFELSQTIYQQLSHGFEDNHSVTQFVEHYQHEQLPYFTSDASGGRGNGTLSDYDWQIDSHLYSAPIQQNWRLFAHQFTGRGKTEEGTPLRVRNGAGIDFRATQWLNTLEINRSNGSAAKTGVATQLSYFPSDHWQFDVGYDNNSNELAWKAYDNGISSKQTTAAVHYQTDSTRSAELSYQNQRLSDGNLSQTWQASATQMVWTKPRHRLDASLALSTSSNRLSDAEYFSPERDYSAGVTLLHQWTPWQSSRRHFTQRTYLTAGEYQQRHFGNSLFAELRLEHQWALTAYSELTYGIGINTHRYDESRENRTLFYLSLTLPLGSAL
ncbi:poly-beta-1,6 N-acetyl-D-glucosamine export porin PgaA [Hafnia paralvei]|uniref:poly-beta-1,6 N-acetyl-D-glucosamine export porin PgaA n=1 Tax=Hafnia paralvei TaxID=546367 RepID=UPI0018F0C3C4|nr:poly-beta-1,6 N-acetyl-D-glucosamine export porin PgaA [Hafnia paralvei]MBW2958435.1 poly-beta-1,6 N-acetyl-D-glucosamine export porin PgaA [Hafnia paralvei]MCQ4170062.1 poly-beta-1,6 N-acetyl-D-glucosamine export porin PgaA [Hafnia paralvei]MDX6913288.1 poly-beta-1,6 N-acetyl-D-glucosamine export porin PgaA [Hafnia paralvei]